MTKQTQELINLGINFLQETDEVTEFKKGWSGDSTYLIKRNDEKYFLKIITNHSCNFDNFKIYESAHINIPKILDFGTLETCKYYVTEYISGSDFGDVIKKYSDDFIYSAAHKLGEEQRTLSKTIEIRKSKQKDVDKLFNHYDAIINQFFENLKKNQDNIDQKYKNENLYKKVLSDIERFKQNFIGEKVYYCHDDFMPNNFMIDSSNNFWTIDIEGTKTDFFAKKLRGYIQHMFHKKEKEKLITFFRGFTQGFFKGKIPKNLPNQIAYIYLVDLIDICNSPLKQSKFKEFQKRANMLVESYENGDILTQCKNLINDKGKTIEN